MSKISKVTIKRIVKTHNGTKISDKAAEAIAAILEKKAKSIAAYAVKNAKKRDRNVVLKEDIEDYILKGGD
jgi:histone H3/H4